MPSPIESRAVSRLVCGLDATRLQLALAGAITLFLLYRRSYSLARVFAVAAVGSLIIGWGVGQYPWMLVDQLTINDAAGAPATLSALLVVVALAAVIVLPPLGYLLRLPQTEKWSRT